jgi:hypothetical protein
MFKVYEPGDEIVTCGLLNHSKRQNFLKGTQNFQHIMFIFWKIVFFFKIEKNDPLEIFLKVRFNDAYICDMIISRLQLETFCGNNDNLDWMLGPILQTFLGTHFWSNNLVFLFNWKCLYLSWHFQVMVAWRIGHRIRLRNWRSGFESRRL